MNACNTLPNPGPRPANCGRVVLGGRWTAQPGDRRDHVELAGCATRSICPKRPNTGQTSSRPTSRLAPRCAKGSSPVPDRVCKLPRPNPGPTRNAGSSRPSTATAEYSHSRAGEVPADRASARRAYRALTERFPAFAPEASEGELFDITAKPPTRVYAGKSVKLSRPRLSSPASLCLDFQLKGSWRPDRLDRGGSQLRDASLRRQSAAIPDALPLSTCDDAP